MNNFTDLATLCRVMENVYRAGAGAPGRDIFTEALVSKLELTKEQAALYASVVLSRNTDGSADRARSAAAAVMGRWTGAQSQGINPSVYVSGTQDTWEFKDDLTYSHRQTSYEGYVSPPSAFGSFSYSRPREHVAEGMWAPPDWSEQSGPTIVIISYAGAATRLTFEWTDPSSLYHSSCKINGFAYART